MNSYDKFNLLISFKSFMHKNGITEFSAGPCGEIRISRDNDYASFDLGTIQEVEDEIDKFICEWTNEK